MFKQASNRVYVVILSLGAFISPGAVSAAEGAQEIEEIVVTARKRAESAQNAPLPVTVLSQSELEKMAIESLDDLASAVPGLVIGDHSGGAGGSIYLRGIGSAETNPLIEQAIATNIDGVLAGSGQIRKAAFMDLAQVEVLRGPQALFFGKNSPGGVMSITTADPGDRFEARIRGSREFEAEEDVVEAMVSGPLSDTLGARLSVSYLESDGYLDVQQFSGPGIVPIGVSTYPGTEELFLRGTLLWDNDNGTSVRAKLTYVDSDVDAGAGVAIQRIDCPTGSPQGQPDFPCRADNTTQTAGVPASAITVDPSASDLSPSGFRNNEQQLGSIEINHDLTDNLTVTSITGYYDIEDATGTPFSLGPINILNSPNNTFEMEQWSQEIRLLSDFDGQLNFMLDAYYETRDSSTGTSATVFGFFFLGREIFEQEQTAYSLAAQVIWTPSDALEITLGGRASEEDKDIEVAFNGVRVPTAEGSDNWSNFSPELTVAYRPNSEWMIYGSYKEGFKSGGFDASFGAAGRTGRPYDQEEVDGFEVGAKALLLDRSLAVNLVAFSYEYDGLQVSTFDNATTSLQVRNATGADISGLEVDFVWETGVDGLRLSGGYAYNDTEYGSFLTQCYAGQTIALGCNAGFNPATGAFTVQDVKGEPLVLAPEVAANLGVAYEMALSADWRFNASATWRYSDGYTGLAGGPSNSVQDSVSTFDGSLSFSSERWSFAIRGRNLSDEFMQLRTIDTPFTGTGTGTAVGFEGDRAANLTRGREIMAQVVYHL